MTVTPDYHGACAQVPLGSPRPTGMWTVERVRVAIEPGWPIPRYPGWRGGLFIDSACAAFTGTLPTSPTCLGQGLSACFRAYRPGPWGVHAAGLHCRLASLPTPLPLPGLRTAISVPVAYGERFTRLAVESIRTHVANTLADIRDAVRRGNPERVR